MPQNPPLPQKIKTALVMADGLDLAHDQNMLTILDTMRGNGVRIVVTSNIMTEGNMFDLMHQIIENGFSIGRLPNTLALEDILPGDALEKRGNYALSLSASVSTDIDKMIIIGNSDNAAVQEARDHGIHMVNAATLDTLASHPACTKPTI